MLPTLKVFVWLLFHNRLNTRGVMRRKQWHLDSGYTCALCASTHLETREHLFFECEFARGCWEALGIHWDLSQHITSHVMAAKQFFVGPCFMEILGCATWNIWKMRNDLIFQGQNASINRWKVKFQGDLMLHRFKVKEMLVQPLIDWLLDIFT
jgi:hypothetical protein